jgi:hypothetical protein
MVHFVSCLVFIEHNENISYVTLRMLHVSFGEIFVVVVVACMLSHLLAKGKRWVKMQT